MHSHALERIGLRDGEGGVIGASGFTGAELLRLLAAHPELDVVHVTGDTAGRHGRSPTPTRAWPPPTATSRYERLRPGRPSPGSTSCSSPCRTAHSQRIVPELRGKVGHVVDLAADFRLPRPGALPAVVRRGPRGARAARPTSSTACPSCSATELRGAELVAVPGLLPDGGVARPGAARAGRARSRPTGIIVDAASGVSGAGKGKFPFCGTDEDFTAYGLLDHRHTPEIEHATSAAHACCSRRTWRR